MGLEAVTYVNDLNIANPPGTDDILQGDDHIRNIKTGLKNTFPNADKAFYLPDHVSKTAAYTILAADINKFFSGDATAGAFDLTLPALGASNDGWYVYIMKVDSTANAVGIVGTINGSAGGLSLTSQWDSALVWWTGTAWRAVNFQVNTGALTVFTAPDAADLLPMFDVSANLDRSVTAENFFKVLSSMTAEAAPATDDKLALYDTSASAAKAMTFANFMKITNALTEDTGPSWANDFFAAYDTSGGVASKIKGNIVNSFGGALLHVRDQKASGTDGGTFTVGAWRTRTLQTTLTNEISGASLASNQITLPAGTYYIEASAPCFNGDHQAKLRNTTDGSDTLIGTSEAEDGSDPTQTRSHIRGRFTIAAQKIFEIQHQTSNTQSTTGFGRAVGFGVTEVYTDVQIWKVL
jgi:hypothetical protein